jgi:hypothetical protein
MSTSMGDGPPEPLELMAALADVIDWEDKGLTVGEARRAAEPYVSTRRSQ